MASAALAFSAWRAACFAMAASLRALADEMPRGALRATTVDLQVPGARIGDVLSELVRAPAGPGVPVPPDIRLEVDIAAGERVDSEVIGRFSDPCAVTCPNCHGVMSLVRGGKPLRFRCQVGHAFGPESLAAAQVDGLEQALVSAVRTHRDRLMLFHRMAEVAEGKGLVHAAQRWKQAAAEAEASAGLITNALAALGFARDA